MRGRKRIYYTAAQRAEIWDRWQRGETLEQIARQLDGRRHAVKRLIAASGGIRPAARRRARHTLRLDEREEISRGLAQHQSIRAIARSLSRSPSTISREIARHGGSARYRATTADQRAWDRARRPKRCKLAVHDTLANEVATGLKAWWSPQQIAGWLKRRYPDQPSRQVSHETIYRTLFVQTRGALKKELLSHLRRTRAMRRSRHHTLKSGQRGQITNAVSISERPPEVEDRAVPGHWEGDLVFGGRNSQIATLVERHTRYVMLLKVADRNTETVINALIDNANRLPRELYGSLTWDRGSEMADHCRFTLATDIQVYFCDPRHPWQRGSNENTNGLLRQYFPKGMDLSAVSQKELDAAARSLNGRPRKTLNFETPAERYEKIVATIY
ncbi:Fis family transcriptional regulator [Salinisphaera sp. T5B8]|uniref:IS30 family transposase n=1 Tax=Salinisphaera sp. T5B8 TaxID=1304154 RepID=UPI003341D1AA